MKPRLFLILIISLLLLALGVSAIALAQEAAPIGADAPAGTAFTYQGQLKDASGPVTDSCDFQLGLWDALSGGTQVGTTLTRSGVAVSEGLFTVQLDFGANAFNGNARWLETAVRCPSGGGVYNTLSPRQPLTPAPYALYSANTDKLDGQHGSAFQQHYQNLLVVAKSGGDYTTITDALNSITDNSADNPYLIYVAPGVYTEKVTMKLYIDIEGAGEKITKVTYTGSSDPDTGTIIGADHAEIRFLSVENTGGATYAIAIYSYNTSSSFTHVTAAAWGGIHNLCVMNQYSSSTMTNVTATASGGTNSYGVYNESSSPTMMNVNAHASGGSYSIGVGNNASSTAMTNVTATASGGTNNYGVRNQNFSSSTMTNVTATASDGTNSYGVFNEYSSPTMTNVTASASGGTNNYGVYNLAAGPTMIGGIASALGGTYSYGVFNYSSFPIMTGGTASSSGGTNNYGLYSFDSSPVMTSVTSRALGEGKDYGMWNDSSSPTIQNSAISAMGGYPNDGIHNDASSGSYIVNIINSKIDGSNSTIYQVDNYTTKIGASQLSGGGAFGGTYLCVASYNGNYAPLNGICQP